MADETSHGSDASSQRLTATRFALTRLKQDWSALSAKKRRALVLAGLLLMAFDAAFLQWWRHWASGNELFDCLAGEVVEQRGDRMVALSRAEVLAEARQQFTFCGQPIHPKIVDFFSGSLADFGPSIMAVDVTQATGTNECHHEVRRRGEGWLEITTVEPDDDGLHQEFFAYRYLGALKNGTQVLETCSYGSGSGQFTHLLFVRFELVGVSGRDRLLLRFVDHDTLGDRFRGEVTLHGDCVVIRGGLFNEENAAEQVREYIPER